VVALLAQSEKAHGTPRPAFRAGKWRRLEKNKKWPTPGPPGRSRKAAAARKRPLQLGARKKTSNSKDVETGPQEEKEEKLSGGSNMRTQKAEGFGRPVREGRSCKTVPKKRGKPHSKRDLVLSAWQKKGVGKRKSQWRKEKRRGLENKCSKNS